LSVVIDCQTHVFERSYWYLAMPWFAPRMHGRYADYHDDAKGMHRVADKYGDVVMALAHYETPIGCRTQVSCAASKGAVEAFTRSVAIELAEHGTTANAVAPGGATPR
jgi:NAD(P)-dependent dehydrogenase (short-subunit alcohol dehydrogenase family)